MESKPKKYVPKALAAVEGMPMVYIGIADTKVSDLSPLCGISLTRIDMINSPIVSIAPLKEMKLTALDLTGRKLPT